MILSKRVITVSSIIAGLLLLFAIRGSTAVLPSWLPSNTQLAGYSQVWNNTVSVSWYTDRDVSGNVTCYTQVWLKNGSSGLVDANVIGASMIDKGGNILNIGIDLTQNTPGAILAKTLLADVGVNQTQMSNIKSVWQVIVAVLVANQGTTYVITQPTIANMDHVITLNFPSATDYKYVLFGTRKDHCLVLYSFNVSQDWITWLSTSGHESQILSRMQLVTWSFWIHIAKFVGALVQIASWLGLTSSSSADANFTNEAPLPASIGISAYTPTSELESFAIAWGAMFPNAIPGYDIWIIVLACSAAFSILILKTRRHRDE